MPGARLAVSPLDSIWGWPRSRWKKRSKGRTTQGIPSLTLQNLPLALLGPETEGFCEALPASLGAQFTSRTEWWAGEKWQCPASALCHGPRRSGSSLCVCLPLLLTPSGVAAAFSGRARRDSTRRSVFVHLENAVLFLMTVTCGSQWQPRVL